MRIINENFSDFNLCEYPYDRFHTALGEYHHIVSPGYYGNWYDPISLHQWRSLDGSWMVTEENGVHYMEQNRGDNSKDAFKNVYCCLTHKSSLFSSYTLSFKVRLFEVNHYCGMAFYYITSRNYYAVGINGKKIALYHRNEETFDTISENEIDFDDFKDYSIKVIVDKHVIVYLDDKKILEGDVKPIYPSKISLVAKSACRYSDVYVDMSELEYQNHLELMKKLNNRLEEKRSKYSPLECIKKIDLKDFGSGRQLRIARTSNKTIFILAQHQKRMIRDSFAHLSSMTAFDIEGNVLWKIGESSPTFDNTFISCDLPFQIADINNDGRLEVIYARNFMVHIIDLLDGHEIKSMKTPIIKDDPLVKNEPFYRLNVDAIRVADFEGLGYKGDFIIKDRYQNVWAYNKNMELMFRYHHKNTGHFPYIYDFNNDGKDEMFVGYDMVNSKGEIVFSLPMNSDHTDEIIYAPLDLKDDYKLVLASGNEGMNIVNLDGTIYKHNEIGHAQRISVAKFDNNMDGLGICATAFWGSDGIVCTYDKDGNLLHQIEVETKGTIITPVSYDGVHNLILLHAGNDGGLVDFELDRVVPFPLDNHPDISTEVFDIDGDGIDEIICWDLKEMWIYKAKEFICSKDDIKYPLDSFSNYRGEYIIPKKN